MITIEELLESKPRELFRVTVGDTVADALRILAAKKIGALLVMKGDALVGMLSERDCALKVALPGKQASEVLVGDVMTAAVITVDTKESLPHCIEQMNERDIRHLPVLKDGKVIGIVSIGDASKELMKEQARLIEHLETYINRGFRL